MSAAQAGQAPSPGGLRARRAALRLPIVDADAVYGGVLGVVLAWSAIRANGGLRIGSLTTVEIVTDLLGGTVAVVALLSVPAARTRVAGAGATALFGLFVLSSLVSAVWSIDPNASWLDANRLVSYLAVFGAGLALVRLAPHRWGALLGGLTTAAVIVSGYAVLHKMFPAALQPDETYARLREPFGYWNAVGLMAAMGVPGCLWLGARRAGHAALSAFAYPAIGLLIVVILLSYSRGALLALGLGLIFWFVFTPLRLAGFVVFGTSTVGGGLLMLWAFGQDALTKDRVPIDLQDSAGLELFVAVLAMLVVLFVAGLAIGFARARYKPSAAARKRAAIAIWCVLALIPIGVGIELASADRGFFGTIGHAAKELTDPHAKQPPNDPGRLTGVASVRARYWNDGFKIFKDHPWFGVGSDAYATSRLRYRDDDLQVQHAHGYVPQVLADRGIVGMLLSLLALAGVALAAARAVGLKRGGTGGRTTPERVALLSLASILIIFGVHSFVDWTWFIPGVAMPALLAGGWLCGRGPLELPPRAPQRLLRRLRLGLGQHGRVAAATIVAALAIVAAWAAWQPQRSIDKGNQALDAAAAGHIPQARKLVQTARKRNPLSVDPYFESAAIETSAKNLPGALAAYESAVKLQPGNPVTWTRLADFQLNSLHKPAAAKETLAAALYLDPRSADSISLLIEANRQLAEPR